MHRKKTRWNFSSVLQHRCHFHMARLAIWQFSFQQLTWHFADPKDQRAPSDHRSLRGRTASCEAAALQCSSTDSYRDFHHKDTAGSSEPGRRHYPGGSNSGKVGGEEAVSQPHFQVPELLG